PETGSGNDALMAGSETRRHRDLLRMARNRGHLQHWSAINRRDATAWLGRQDSNLGMAESKSDYSACNINAHFEKTAGYDRNSMNRLSMIAKWQYRCLNGCRPT